MGKGELFGPNVVGTASRYMVETGLTALAKMISNQALRNLPICICPFGSLPVSNDASNDTSDCGRKDDYKYDGY